MEPRIQYAKTTDGVSIAYCAEGDGPPFVLVSLPSHLSAEWRMLGATYERLAKDVRLVRLDHRGFGLSDREPEDMSLDAYVSDLEAVVDKLELSQFVLFSNAPPSTPIAIAYAARHSNRVSRLLLTGSVRNEPSRSEQFESILNMPGVDWEFKSQTLARIMMGWDDEETARSSAELIRRSVDLEGFKRFSEAAHGWDVSDLLPLVSSPTLVMNSDNQPWYGAREGRELTAGLQNGQLVMLDGATGTERNAQVEAAVRAFLGSQPGALPEPTRVDGGLMTILFTDMESSIALTDQLGDAAAQVVRRAHNDIVRSALGAHGGNEIKHTGDGIMASFATASSALDSAIAIQRGVAEHKEAHPDSPLGVYVGLNAGEPISEDDDLFGTSVDLAARLVAHAQPGQIVASDVVRQLAAGKDFLFSDLGETELRGFEDPVKLWELRWQDA